MLKPRLKTSKKSAGIPVDYVKLVKDLINKNFKRHLKGKTVLVEGDIFTEEVCLRIGFKTDGQLKCENFEASLPYSAKDKNILDQLNLAIDALGSMIQQYFEADGDIELPRTWHEFDMDGKKIYLQFTTENPDLEKEADKLLGEDDDEDAADWDDDSGEDND